MVAPFSKFYGKMWVAFWLNSGKRFFLEVSKPTETAQIVLTNGTRDFQNNTPFESSACFYVTISKNFERFQYFNSDTKTFVNKLEYCFLVESTKTDNAAFNTLTLTRKPLSTSWSTVFQLKALRLTTHHFHTKLSYQKPIQPNRIEYIQYKMNLITKNGVLPVTTLFFTKVCFS